MIRTVSAGSRPTTYLGSRRFAAIACISFFTTGCAGDFADPAVAEGRGHYEASCASCHGDAALGDGPMAATLPVRPPALMEHLGHHTEAQLVQLIRNGLPPAMPPTALDEGEIRQIIAYLWTLVPETEVAALREMQQHMEMADSVGMGMMSDSAHMEMMMGDSAHMQMMMDPSMAHMPGMSGTGQMHAPASSSDSGAAAGAAHGAGH